MGEFNNRRQASEAPKEHLTVLNQIRKRYVRLSRSTSFSMACIRMASISPYDLPSQRHFFFKRSSFDSSYPVSKSKIFSTRLQVVKLALLSACNPIRTEKIIMTLTKASVIQLKTLAFLPALSLRRRRTSSVLLHAPATKLPKTILANILNFLTESKEQFTCSSCRGFQAEKSSARHNSSRRSFTSPANPPKKVFTAFVCFFALKPAATLGVK